MLGIRTWPRLCRDRETGFLQDENRKQDMSKKLLALIPRMSQWGILGRAAIAEAESQFCRLV